MANAPTIILIKPQMGENIGMCARAMLNCGVTDLRLVAPRDGWPNPSAEATASRALSIIENVRVFETTKAAIADLHFVLATTARPRDMTKYVYDADTASHEISNRAPQNCGILFGPERTGLENEDIALANGIITLPMNPDYASLNLAQAVLLICYEWRKRVVGDQNVELDAGKALPALQKDMSFFCHRLEKDLEALNFFPTQETQDSIMRNITSLFSRCDLTDQELKTLHGILSAYLGKKLK